jgi:predicted aspartyl protease
MCRAKNRAWRAALASLIWLRFARAATEAPPPAGAATAAGNPLPAVVVEAAEPKYAAPTRRDRIGRIWAPVFINGQGPFRLVLDTGANGSAVIARVATALNLPLRDSASVQLRGVTGSAIVPTIAVNRLEVGDLNVAVTQLPIVADVFGGADGVLGASGLSDKRILIDFGRDRIVISRSHGEPAGVGFTRIPLKQAMGQLLIADMSVGGIRTKAIIDTGAQQTVGNSALRGALMRRTPNAKKEDIIGVTLDVYRGDSIPAPPIDFGPIEITGLSITFGDMFIFDYWKMNQQPAVLVGMDVLGELDTLIIDYKMRELQLRLHAPRSL